MDSYMKVVPLCWCLLLPNLARFCKMMVDMYKPTVALPFAVDASESGCAVCVATGLTVSGLRGGSQLALQTSPCVDPGIILVEPFEGYGGARQALELLNVRIA